MMILGRIARILVVGASIAVATAAAPSFASEAANLCHGLMQFLPPAGALVEGDTASIIAKRAGKAFVVDPSSKQGLSVEPSNDNPGKCPAIRLTQNTQSGRAAVELPDHAGRYCGEVPVGEWPTFSVATISGTQALLARYGSYLEVTKRNPNGWGSPCSIKLTLATTYSVSKAFCQQTSCTFLEHIAPYLAEYVTSGNGAKPTPGLVALWSAGVPPAEERQWEAMRRIGLSTLRSVPLLISGKEAFDGLTYFDDQNGTRFSSYNGAAIPGEVTAYVPIESGNKLLLGKIGAEGLGCCREFETQLLSVYQLTGDKLEPVASFVLEPFGHRLVSASEK